MKDIKILDCTIRDGGFYNLWDFSFDFVSDYVSSVERSGIDYIELGYRSLNDKSYYGPFKYTDDYLLREITESCKVKIATMVDAKEFVGREAEITSLFLPKHKSPVNLVRLVTSGNEQHMAATGKLVEKLHNLGYETTINLMAISTIDQDQRKKLIKQIADTKADVLYVADSYGGLLPEDVAEICDLFDNINNKQFGIHLHNNQEMAFANAIEAMKNGVTWIDSSMMGMGRGPGNLRSEVLLQYLQTRMKSDVYKSEPIYEFIDKNITSLHEKYKWGASPEYVLSGNLGVHPTYAQKLISSNRYSINEVVSILHKIDELNEGSRYNEKVLNNAISLRGNKVQEVEDEKSYANTDKKMEDWKGQEVLIIGRGPSTANHASAINRYIKSKQPIVIECNYIPEIEASNYHYCAYLVVSNALNMIRDNLQTGKKVILGIPVPGDLTELLKKYSNDVFYIPYEVKNNTLDVNELIIPHDVVSMYAIAFAVRKMAGLITVVGFDGYADSLNERDKRMQHEMEEFFELFSSKHKKTQVISLLKTSYNIDSSSIYAKLSMLEK